MKLEDWQQRVIDEKRELDERLQKLSHFMQSPAFARADRAQQGLLHEQHDLMGRLSVVLGRRIALFGLTP